MSSALEELVRQHPDMEPAAATLRILATILPEPSLASGVPHLEAARARLNAGVPALEGEPLLGGTALSAQLVILASALNLPNPAGGGLLAADLDELASAAQTGIWDPVAATAERIGLERDYFVTLLDHAARPALRVAARAVRQLIVESRWNRGACPACGSPPLLGELRGGSSGGAEQERVLRCVRCLTEWAFPRLRCVACGETDHRKLSYLHGSGEGAYRRAEVCSTCRTYVKSVAVLAPLTPLELLGVDLATAPLDLAALDRGFHR